MAKQLNVSLAFTADTHEAKAQLQDLQKQLNNILKTPSNKLGITDDIREAISATAELSSRLQQATNVNTGNLDFSKFNNSLKQSGQSLSAYGQQLQKLGPTGQQAFLTLTKSIAIAEIPIKRTNALVKEFTTTLANTARWQISSSVLHGLMGSMQSAYRYAQDLNESLNDIRIVTGQSVDQMARFAAEANAAAKALSATTVEYTNASLIYYQQGLSDQQVKERTDITIKMANVSKQSAEVVSEQMTAVWNNFYNGSKSLEYYADVMTALGAATASSADEIAGGLEKFAAIGDTIGLSYEYAAAALATITSNTRQSEEVVGTALKTIFARIQGLNLGETLDDGTTLNKYSSALEKVGISIFDSAGELKRMDDILNEMGAKWETLNKAQQTALAQTVAGARQYTQLVALMDNWDKGDSDSMKANLSTAYGSSGALQEQADIYAESWEAARDRVTAAAEKIYKALLNDDFFIDVLNGFEKVLGFVSQLIDSLGGLKGVFLALGAIVTKVFSAQLSQGLSSMAYNIKMAFPSGREAVEKERRDFIENAVNSIPQSNEYTTDVEKAQQDSLRTELTLQMEYMDNAEKMSAIEAETNKKLIERTRLLKEQTVEIQKQKEKIDTKVSDGVMDLRTDISAFNMTNRETGETLDYNTDIQPQINNIKAASKVQAELTDLNTTIELLSKNSDQGKTALAKIKESLLGLDTKADKDIARLVAEINKMGDSPDPEQLRQALEALNLELEESIKISNKRIKDVVSPEASKKVDALTQDLREQAKAAREVRVANEEAKKSQEETSQKIAGATGAQKQWSDVMVESANVAFNVASAISMVSSAIDTLKDPDVSGMQKLVTVLSTMGMVLPTIISLIGTMKKLFSSETVAKIANAAATWAQVAAEKKYNETKNEGSGITKKNIKETWQDTVWKNTKKENQDKYIEQVLKDKGYIRDKKTGGWGKTAVGKNGAKRFDPSTVISNDDAVKMATPDAQKMAGKGAFKALGSKAASLGIAAAGIAVIIGTVAMVVNQLNKAEKAVQKAKEAAQSLSENYDNVKASYDNFINAQSGYETATASMKELTKGTVAYQEALMQANEAAGELLATNKNLKYTIEDGKIVIDEKSLEQAKVDELKKVETAQAAKIAGQQELDKAEIALDKRNMARDLKSDADWGQKGQNAVAGGALAGLGTGLAAGALVGGGVFSVPAALVGGLIGLIGGAITGLVAETSTDTENEAIDLLAQQAEKDETFLARLKAGEVSSDELKTIGIEDEGLIASLQKNGEEVAALVGEMQANTAAINAQNDLVASNVLSDNEAVQNSEYRDQIVDIAGDAYGHAYDKAMKSDWVDTWGKEGIAQINGANDEAKKVFEEYLKYAGLEGQGYELTDTTGNDDNREFVYKDKEGNEHKVSLEAMQAARAAYEASSTLDDSATKLAETFDKLADSSNEADQALLSFVSGKNFEGATKGELEDIQEEAGIIEKNDDGTFTQDSLNNVQNYLEGALGETLTNDVANRYGYESADAMIQAFATKLSDADEAWDNIKIPNEFKFADDMSLGTAQALEKQIEKMNLGPLGEKAGEDYVNALNSMLGKLDIEDQQKALSALTAIDWSDWDAMDQAEQIMKDLGVEIDTSSAEWQEFIENMRLANGAMPDFSQIKADLNQVCAILDKIDFGSVISEEDYARLVAYNDEWERFFMLQADGTRKFIGNSADMKQETRDSINEQRKELQYRKEIQEGMDNAGWNVNGEKVDWYKSGDQFSYAGSAQNLMNASGDTQKVLEELGYTDSVIQEMIDEYNKAVESSDEEAIKKAEERFETMYNGIGDFLGEDLDIIDAELNEMMASTATSFAELNQLFSEGLIGDSKFGSADEFTAYEKAVQNLAISGANAATSLTELQAVWSQALATGVELDYSIYADNLLRLAESYSICADEARSFEIALQSGNKTAIEAAEQNLEASIMLGEAAEKYGFQQEELSIQAKQLAKEYKLDAKAAAQLAIQNQRMNKGVETLVNNWKNWSKQLKATDHTSRDWATAAAECTKAIADLVGASEDLELPDDFFDSADNLALIDAAANGSVDAINKLGLAVAAAQVQMMNFQTGMTNINGSLVNETQFNYWKDTIMSGITDLQNALSNVKMGDNVYDQLGGDQWVSALNQMAVATGMSVEQMNSMLNSMGVQAKVDVVDVPQTMKVPTYTEYSTVSSYTPPTYDQYDNVVSPGTWSKKTWTVPGESKEVEGVVQVAQISTEDSGIGKPQINFIGNGGVSNSAKQGDSSGGGGNTPAKAEKTKVSRKSDFGERYHTVNKQLENTTREMENASKAADKLWSRDRLKYLDEQNAKLDEEIGLLQEKQRQAKEYLEEDTRNLNSAASDLGFSITYGADGEILNYDSIRDTYAAQMIAAQEHMNTFATKDEQDAYNETIIEPLQEKIDAFESAMSLYYDTLGVMQDNEDKIQENLDQKMQNNFDKWSGMLELDIAINERDLELLDYYLSKVEDDVYSMAEAAALMVGSLSDLQSGKTGGQLGEYLSNLNIYNEALDDLNNKLATGAITEAAYEEGLETIRSGLMDNLQSINELDKAMLSYYSDTLSMVTEEIDKYSEKMEHQTSILEHYANMMEILGKSQDYDAMGTILEGQVKTIKNELEVAEAEYELYAAEAESKRKLYEDAVAAGNVDAAELYKGEWEAAEEAATEAQSNMLDKTEQWAEAMKAVVENKLSGLAKSLEEALTGGTSFDQINTQLERAASLQEEYLTTTNQIYETNKLMRTAQQAMDKMTNTVAKQRMKDFIKETDQLQDKSKLSKYELEIQQAKYDLLLAEIALEDAQNTKSTVRLQRDSEGNMGYVYTADQSKIAEAQQQLEDAQNSLYNIGLEGANNYTEKYNQTMQEMYDTLTSITQAYYDGEIASQEEYEEQMLAAQEYYYEQLENYQDLYGVALQTDTRVIKDAWSTGMGAMKIETRTWKDAVATYTSEATTTLVNWYASVESIAQKTGLDNIANKVKNVADESTKLKNTILGVGEDKGVIGALADELIAVGNLTGGYTNLRSTIQGLISDYELLMNTVNNAQNQQQAMDSKNENGTGGTSGDSDTDNGTDTGTTAAGTQSSDPTPGSPGATTPTIATGQSVTVKTTATHFSRDGGNGTRMRSFVPGGNYTVMNFDDDEVLIGKGGVATGWVKKTDLVGFDTGGYTGTWGSYGKMAMLHEKELILNQGDTANFLASMEVLERILEIIDLQSANAQLGGMLHTPGLGNGNNTSIIEQSVHIEASFPGVSDRNEIEEAFNNLINTASQYANRK